MSDTGMRVSGGTHQTEAGHHYEQQIQRHVVAEMRAWELVEALKAALANTKCWQWEAQRLLELIQDGCMPEPRDGP